MSRPVRVLIIDDSAMVRQVLSMGLAADPLISVMGAASNAEQAWQMMQAERPDVITLDVEMPGMDGVSFLRRYIPQMPVPTVVISALTHESAPVTLQAMEAGAVDVIEKPALGVGEGLPAIMRDVCARVRAAASARPTPGRLRPVRPRAAALAAALGELRMAAGSLIAIGASTGGVQALGRILPMFPAESPGIVIVQHMPTGFTGAFAKRLNADCAMEVIEARDGDEVRPGRILLAPGGDRHMEVQRGPTGWRVTMTEGAPVCFSRPSVDVLFRSVARHAGRDCAAALLTGMGKDGAAGMLAIRAAGGRTIAQDEASCVVYGMPLAAVELGAAETVLPLDEIPDRLIRSLACRPTAVART